MSSRRMNWATIFGVTRSFPGADSVAVSRVTRSGKGATILARSAWGTPRSSHCPPPPISTTLSSCANSYRTTWRAMMHRRVSPPKPPPHAGGEARFRPPVALRAGEEFPVIDIGVTEAGRHGQADLGSAAAHFLGDRQNRHGLILLPRMPSGRASRAERVGRWREHSRVGRRGQGRSRRRLTRENVSRLGHRLTTIPCPYCGARACHALVVTGWRETGRIPRRSIPD